MKKPQSVKPYWLPDWRDKTQYPDSKTTIRQWAWEFLRRNCEYQKLWNELIAPYYDPKDGSFDQYAAMSSYYKRDDAGIVAHMANISANANKDHIVENHSYIVPAKDVYAIFEEEFGVSVFPPDPSVKNVSIWFTAERMKYSLPFPFFQGLQQEKLEDNEIGITFDLCLPLSPQIKMAKKLLKNRQLYLKESNKITVSKKRNRIDNYQNYLRILDAHASDISLADIATVIYPKIENRYPDYLGTLTVRDDLNAAKTLVHEGYKFISLNNKK